MEQPICQHCGKQLRGRSDKRFCNDDCRNTFNRTKHQLARTASHENFPEIFRIIRKNYEILQKNGPILNEGYTSSFSREGTIEDTGLDTRFFTSMWQDNFAHWRFCFDYGWRNKKEGGWEIIYRPEQASLEQPAKKTR